MNCQTNEWIQNQITRHYEEALEIYKPDQIVGIFCQGSQNYGLALPNSDIDTKCILTPIFKDICLAKSPISTTHILNNNEHLDAKDIRSYVSCFRKQNLNFLEILFTPYYLIHPDYAQQWNRLVAAREQIAHMNPCRAVKSMKGIALEKYHAMKHPYPSKLDILNKYGYDGKQVHHLVRVDNFLTRYIKGEEYADCLIPDDKTKEFLIKIKRNEYSLHEAEQLAEMSLAHVEKIADVFCELNEERENPEIRELLEDVSYNIMKIAVEKELNNGLV